MRAKYNVESSADLFRSTERASPWWKDIRSVCFPIAENCWFDNLIVRRVGQGNCTKFWIDNWADDAGLLNSFNRLYRLSNQQNHYIKDMGVWEDNTWKWQFEWRRELRLVEEESLQHLKQVLVNVELRKGVEDSWIWAPDAANGYSVKSAYSFLHGVSNSEPDQVFSVLWSIPAPSNPKAFMWRVFWNRIQTKDNLRRRGILASQEEVRCPFCMQVEESMEHLLFSCVFASSLWKLRLVIDGWVILLSCQLAVNYTSSNTLSWAIIRRIVRHFGLFGAL